MYHKLKKDKKVQKVPTIAKQYPQITSKISLKNIPKNYPKISQKYTKKTQNIPLNKNK